MYLFLHMLWKFQTQRTLKVRSLGHVKWPHLRKVLILVIATPNDRSPWNFERLIIITVSIKCISRNFYIGDPRSGQFCDLSFICQCEKIERSLFWTKTIWNTLKPPVRCRLDILKRNIATSDPSCRRGHFRSWKLTSSFSEITFGRQARAMKTP